MSRAAGVDGHAPLSLFVVARRYDANEEEEEERDEQKEAHGRDDGTPHDTWRR